LRNFLSRQKRFLSFKNQLFNKINPEADNKRLLAHKVLRTYFASVSEFLLLFLFLEKRNKKSRLTEICLVSAAKNRAETKPQPRSGLRVLRGFLSHKGRRGFFTAETGRQIS
jgi:hypothetical protein